MTGGVAISVNRREILTFGMTATFALVLPLQSEAQTSAGVIVTKMEISAETPETDLIKFLDRRTRYGQLSRQVLRTSSHILLIEEWKSSAPLNGQRFVRKGI